MLPDTYRRNSSIEKIKEQLSNLPTDKGILFATGYKKTNKSTPFPLFVVTSTNIKELFITIDKELGENINISSLSYKCINEDLELLIMKHI